MDFSKITRKPAPVIANLKKMPDKSLVTVKGCKIYVPSRFEERGLAEIGIDTYIVGIFMMTFNDEFFAITLTNAMFHIDPTSTSKVMIGEDEFYEFVFDPGSTVVKSVLLVRTDTLVYKIYDELFSKGRVPMYVGYKDMAFIFATAIKHANAAVGKHHQVTELLVSLIARDVKNRHMYYRATVKDANWLVKNPPAWIPLRSVTYAATNTTNKLGGSYFHEGVVSALNSPAERVERIEGLLSA